MSEDYRLLEVDATTGEARPIAVQAGVRNELPIPSHVAGRRRPGPGHRITDQWDAYRARSKSWYIVICSGGTNGRDWL